MDVFREERLSENCIKIGCVFCQKMKASLNATRLHGVCRYIELGSNNCSVEFSLILYVHVDFVG